jgi:aspartyl-tRNA(Asn)/glutamyl-tRNA(Gln) amidotransferase subunit A
MSDELALKTIAQLYPLLENKQLSPVELTESVLRRVERYDGTINSYISITVEAALSAARQAEADIQAGNYRGKLHGIPLALKDIFDFQNENVTIGSKIHQNYVPGQDATVVRHLKDAGAFFTGKLNLHEYACGGTTNNEHYGPCRNPWNTNKIPGGSSGGSAAAVAANLTYASLGTDTAGSIRIPSAACGTVGLKPTFGLVSKYGCFPLAWSLDHIGPITKSVEDAAIMLDAIAGYDPKDPHSVKAPQVSYHEQLNADIRGKVIGIEEDFYFHLVDNQIAQAVKSSIQKLEQLGARIEIVKIPHLKYAKFAEFVTFASEAGVIHRENIRKRPEDFGTDVRMILRASSMFSSADYIQAQQIRLLMKEDFLKAFEKVDVIAAPTLPLKTPDIGQQMTDINGTPSNVDEDILRLTCPANLTGLPAISVPCGFADGMPVGLQIIGKAYAEPEILNVAYAFEQVQPFAQPELKIY